MPALTITEFKNAASPIGTYAPDVLPMPPLANQSIGLTSGGATGVLGPNTYAVLMISDTDCWFAMGGTGSTGKTGATGGAGVYLPAKVPLIFAVPPSATFSATL
jgi:hypothetical protein